MWDYSKADFKKMKALFNEEFNTCIKNFTDVGSQYAIFHSTLNQVKKDFIPKKVLKLNLHNHHVKLNETARAKSRKKQRLWSKHLNTQDNVYLQFQKVSNQPRTLTRKSVKSVEREISNQVKDNPKAFWKYVNNKWKYKVKIPSDCNGTRTHNHLVHRRTLNHLARLAK